LWLRGVAHWIYGGSMELWYLLCSCSAHRSQDGFFRSLELWWLIGTVVTHWSCGDSLELWWLIGTAVTHWNCCDSLELWWFIAWNRIGYFEFWWLNGLGMAHSISGRLHELSF
jgi:hypothetical protein